MGCDLTVLSYISNLRSCGDTIYQITKRSCNRLGRYLNNVFIFGDVPFAPCIFEKFDCVRKERMKQMDPQELANIFFTKET